LIPAKYVVVTGFSNMQFHTGSRTPSAQIADAWMSDTIAQAHRVASALNAMRVNARAPEFRVESYARDYNS
jgi:hypothetical protein